jgi:hypothetical protein
MCLLGSSRTIGSIKRPLRETSNLIAEVSDQRAAFPGAEKLLLHEQERS